MSFDHPAPSAVSEPTDAISRISRWLAQTEADIAAGTCSIKWDEVQMAMPHLRPHEATDAVVKSWWSAVRRVKTLLYDPAKAT